MAMVLPQTTAAQGRKSLRERAASSELETLTDLPLTTKSRANDFLLEAEKDMGLLILWIGCWASMSNLDYLTELMHFPADDSFEWHFSEPSLYFKWILKGFSS